MSSDWTIAFAKLFLPNCALNPLFAHQASFEGFNPLTFRLTGRAWQRILSQYVESGLLDEHFDSVRTLQDALNQKPEHFQPR